MDDPRELVLDDANRLTDAATAEIEAAASPEALEQVRVKYLGRRGC